MKVKISKKILIILILAFLFLLLSFSFAQEGKDRKLEIEYPKILGVRPEIVKTGLPEYAAYIFNLAIISLGLLALAALIWGGILYLISAGIPAKQKEAKEQMASAFLGIIIILSSYILLTTINPELIIFKVPKPTVKVIFCKEDKDCEKRYGRGFVCDKDKGLCVRREKCSEDKDCPLGYFCEKETGQTEGKCVRKTEYSLIALEIPLGRMIDSGIWDEGTNAVIKNLLDDFEAFLKREVEIEGQKFNRISNLNKTLKSLTDLCNCDAADAHCALPQNKGAPIACSGNPCKDYKKKIDKIVAMNNKIIKNTEETEEKFDGEIKKVDKVDSLIEFKEQLMSAYKVFGSEENRFLTAYDKFLECSQKGSIMTRNQFLTQVETIEEQGGKTKLVQIFPSIPSTPGAAPSQKELRLNIRLTSYWPGYGKVNGVDQGNFYSRPPPGKKKGERVVTVRDFITNPSKYQFVTIAVAQQLYYNEKYKGKIWKGPFRYGDVVRIPHLEKKYPGIRFRVTDTGSALNRYYEDSNGTDIVVDVATFTKGQKPVPHVDLPRNQRTLLIKTDQNFATAPLVSADDPFTFYCIIGGTLADLPGKVTPPPEIFEKKEIPEETPPEVGEFEPLYCPAYIPVGELLDSVIPSAFQSNSDLRQLIASIDELIKALRDINQQVSDCTPANCIPNCAYGPNPCVERISCFRVGLFGGLKICCNPKSLPTCLPCFPGTNSSPGLQTAGTCVGKPEPPYRGSPCPKDNIEKLAGSGTEPEKQGRIKEYEDAIFDLIKILKTNLTERVYEWKTPIGDLNLLNGIRAGTNFCFSRNKTDEPDLIMLNCEMALGHEGPDKKTIADCHPQSFFCCTDSKLKAAVARVTLPVATTKGSTYYYQPPTPFVGSKPSPRYIKPQRPDAASVALSRIMKCMAGKGFFPNKNVVDSVIKKCQPCGPFYKRPPCHHAQYSDHYGCRCGDGCSYAADFPARGLDAQCKVALAARECERDPKVGVKLRIIIGGRATAAKGSKCGNVTYLSGHEGHIHVSVEQRNQCGCKY